MKELIEALGVLANPNASEEEKAAALEKLTAYFNSQLGSEESTATTEGASATETSTETTSEAGDSEEEEDQPSKEMASALATIQALTERVGKIEKASAVGNRPRASKPTVIQRVQPAPMDPQSAVTISMIEKAAKNTIGMLGK